MAETLTEEKAVEGAAPAAKPAGPGMMGMLVSSVVMAVILGGVGFALAYFVLPSRMAQASATATSPAPAAGLTNAATADAATPVTKEKTERPTEGAAANKPITKFTIEELIVNIADTRGNRFVRAGVYFEAAPEVLEELEANRARMVDTVGQVLSTKTLDDLTAPTIRGTLRTELLGIINPTLKAGRVDNIYFTDLLVQ
jgi:flagellar protein FliL